MRVVVPASPFPLCVLKQKYKHLPRKQVLTFVENLYMLACDGPNAGRRRGTELGYQWLP